MGKQENVDVKTIPVEEETKTGGRKKVQKKVS